MFSHPAGAQKILDAIRKRWFRGQHLFAGGAITGHLMDKAVFLYCVIEVVHRTGLSGLQALPRRLGGPANVPLDDNPLPRLVSDYEQHVEVSEAMNHLALGSILLSYIAH